MVTIARLIFINIFQTERLLAVKFAMGYEKIMSSPVIPKLPKVWKKVEKIGLGSFKSGYFHAINILCYDYIMCFFVVDLPFSVGYSYDNSYGGCEPKNFFETSSAVTFKLLLLMYI